MQGFKPLPAAKVIARLDYWQEQIADTSLHIFQRARAARSISMTLAYLYDQGRLQIIDLPPQAQP